MPKTSNFRILWCLGICILTAYFSQCTTVLAQEFTLAPGQSIIDVRDSVRDWHRKNPGKTATVTIAPGTYFLEKYVDFTTEDSCTIYRAENPDQKPVFTRGTAIAGWKTLPNGWLVTKIAEVAEGKTWFETLFVNGKRAQLARTPNADVADGNRYFYVWDVSEQEPGTRFYTREEQKKIVSEIAKLPNPTDVKMMFYHSWESSLHRVKRVDDAVRLVELTGGARWEINRWGASQRYHVEGLESALDQPGEYLLKRDGTCLYIPRIGETAENLNAVATLGVFPFNECGFLKFSGSENEKVHDISFDNVVFAYDVWNLPENGLSDSQSAISSPASILANHAQSLHFTGCVVRNIGGKAFHFHQACRDCSVEKCLLEDLGAGGVYIGPGHGVDLSPPNLTSEITVSNCIIRGYGRLDAGGIGVWIGHSPHNVVVHNDISDGFYTGVSVGWVWGYHPSVAVGNVIEFNHIHDIGHGVLSDMGGVYSLGISPGTSISNNVIHDVYSYNRYGRGGWGLYTDEGSSDIVLENNLVYRTHTGNFHQHYGENNIVRNNIFAFSIEEQLKRSRPEEHRSFTLERNIILFDSSRDEYLLNGEWNNIYSDADRNLYWDFGAPGKIDFGKMTLEQWQKLGKDTTIFIENPHFVDAQNGDFQFTDASRSVLERMGFVAFDFTKAGVLKDDAQWVAELKNWTYPTVILAPDAPVIPFNLTDDFETQRRKPIRKGNQYGKDSSFKIEKEPGNHFLRLYDTPEQEPSFCPFFCYDTHYDETVTGTVYIAFDIRVSVDANVLVEARDGAQPYRVAIPMRILAHEIQCHGNICDNQPGQWTHIEITLPMGEKVAKEKNYTLKITPAGHETRTFELPIENPSWRTLDSFVIAALGNVTAVIDIDNVSITLEKD